MKPTEYDFKECLALSLDTAEDTDPATIKKLIAGCVNVEEAPWELNRRGIDFVATLRRGATLNIDMKTRRPGCSRFWRRFFDKVEPELSLELWSVIPDPIQGSMGIVGWTLDESKLTDYTLHTFDASDTNEVFLLPFQLLRIAFRKNAADWKDRYGAQRQSSGAWESECVFVPATQVVSAINDEMRQDLRVPYTGTP